MPSDLALSSTLIGSNYPCLELIFMVPKVFEPLKFDCMSEILLQRTSNHKSSIHTEHGPDKTPKACQLIQHGSKTCQMIKQGPSAHELLASPLTANFKMLTLV